MNVFISYARKDHGAALRLYRDIQRSGLVPWLDSESMLPGENWQTSISRAIQNSDYFIALLSKNSVSKKGYVQKELKEALDIYDQTPTGNIYLIPARLEDCKPTQERLSEINYADLFPSWEEGVSKILLAMKIKVSPQAKDNACDELEIYIKNNINSLNLKKRPSWHKEYSLVYREHEGDETLYILWNEINERLVKYYHSYDGVRWYGPDPLNAKDKLKAKKAIESLGKNQG